MNKEELIGKLQMVYVGDINALNELIGYYDGLKTIIVELQQENKQLREKVNKFNIDKINNENKSLKGSCKVLGERNNNQRKELQRLNNKIEKLKVINEEHKKQTNLSLQGFIKIGDNKEEIIKLFEEKYMWKPNTLGITEQSHKLLEVNSRVIMTDKDLLNKLEELEGVNDGKIN